MPLYRDFSLFGSTGSESSTASDAFGRLRSAPPFTLFDSSHRYSDNGLWAESTAVGGLSGFSSSEGCVNMTVGLSPGSEVVRETYKVFAYQPGKSMLVMSSFVASTNTGIRQRIGLFGTSNGIFLEISGSTWSFVRRSQSVFTQTIDQSSWNVDKLDGAGPSRITLDKSKAHIFWTDLEWLGVGTVRCGLVINGKMVHCHSFHHANILPTTYMTTATLPLRYEITNISQTSTTSILKQVCSTVISEGGYQLYGAQRAAGTDIGAEYTLGVASTYYPIVSIRLKSSRLDSIAILTALSILPSKSGIYNWRVLAGAVTSGGSWSDPGADSAVEYKLNGTGFSSTGRILASGFISQSNQSNPSVDILKEALFRFQLERNSFTSTPYELTIAVAANSVTGGAGVFASMDWEEISR
jgi:hypothetical protein